MREANLLCKEAECMRNVLKTAIGTGIAGILLGLGMDEPQLMVLVPPDADYGATGVVYPEIYCSMAGRSG